MTTIDGIMYLSLEDLVILGVSKKRESAKMMFDNWNKRTEVIKHPSDARISLIAYSDIPAPTREKLGTEEEISRTYSRRAILSHLKISANDLQNFRQWMSHAKGRFDYNDKCHGLARSAAMVEFIEKTRNKNWHEFAPDVKSKEEWLQVLFEIVKQEKWEGFHTCKTFASFRKKLTIIRQEGISALVSAKYGNQNTRKVDNRVEAIIGEVYAGTKWNDETITHKANEIFEQLGIQKSDTAVQISRTTVRNVLKNPAFQMVYDAERYGKQDWRNNFDEIIWRKPPSRAGILWLIDGTPVECYYKYTRTDKAGRNVVTMGRLYVVFVLDAFAWKIVGYAIGKHGEKETASLVKQAVCEAAQSESYIPHQIAYDHSSGIKQIEPWLKKVAKHLTPAEAGNARSKVIEPFINHFFEKQAKEWANFSGLGIKSKRKCSHISDEWLKKAYMNFPEEQELNAQIQEMITNWNESAASSGPLENRFVEGKRLSPNLAQERSLVLNETKYEGYSEADRVDLFWDFVLDRSGNKETYSYTNGGITIQRQGIRKHFRAVSGTQDWDAYLQIVGKQYHVKVNAQYPSEIWLYEGGRLVCKAEEVERMPMALADREEGDGSLLAEKLKDKKGFFDRTKEMREEAKEMAEDLGMDAELILRNPFAAKSTQHKDRINHAEDYMKDIFSASEEDVANFEL